MHLGWGESSNRQVWAVLESGGQTSTSKDKGQYSNFLEKKALMGLRNLKESAKEREAGREALSFGKGNNCGGGGATHSCIPLGNRKRA